MTKAKFEAEFDKTLAEGDEYRRMIYRRLVKLLGTEEWDPVPDDRIVTATEIMERIVLVLENINMNVKTKYND